MDADTERELREWFSKTFRDMQNYVIDRHVVAITRIVGEGPEKRMRERAADLAGSMHRCPEHEIADAIRALKPEAGSDK
jgi:hypothetical protein